MGYREKTITSIYIPIRLIDLASEVARQRGQSRNQLVVEAIRAVVEREAAADLGAGGQQKESEVRDETQ